MIYLKSEEEIEIMYRAGQMAAQAMEEVKSQIKPGVSCLELDELAEEVIKKAGGESSFKKVPGYSHTVCTTPNDWVVHGVPGDYRLRQGDILGVDLGAFYRGFHSDMAHTFPVGQVDELTADFLKIGEKALWAAIDKVQAGGRIGDISSTIQEIVEGEGFSVVRELVGHGVGKELHEDPLVPGRGKPGTGIELKVGMVLAVEVIYNQGKPAINLLPDGWSITTKDAKLSGLFERTVAITTKGSRVLT
jgi:methionyl aminopeptidase